MNRRNEKFVHRAIVLVAGGISMGIGVVVLKESGEIEKVIRHSGARDALLLMTPLTALLATGYGLVHKSFSSHGLLAELLSIAGAYSFFLSVALPSFLKRKVAIADDCWFWQRACDEGAFVRDHRYSYLLAFIGIVLVAASLVRAKILTFGTKRRD
jgi:hypothetical protein